MSKVCVVGGAGRIGFPLSLAFAKADHDTLIYDINNKALTQLNRGEIPFKEEGAQELFLQVRESKLSITADMSLINKAEFIVICINNDRNNYQNQQILELKEFIDDLQGNLSEKQIVVVRSTVFPGENSKLRKLIQENNSEIELCYCPERIAAGNAIKEIKEFPQIIAGENKDAIKKVCSLFETITKKTIVASFLEAELMKLFTNSWRYTQFATANQFYKIAQNSGTDFYKIRRLMMEEYPRANNLPNAGFTAGPCLLKDTMLLSSFAKDSDLLGHSSMLINESLPNFLVEQLKKRIKLSDKKVGLLGMAFKAECDDYRDSLSFKLKRILAEEVQELLCSDEYFKFEGFVSCEEIMRDCSVIFIGAPHDKYKFLDYKDKELVDVWNCVVKKRGT